MKAFEAVTNRSMPSVEDYLCTDSDNELMKIFKMIPIWIGKNSLAYKTKYGRHVSSNKVMLDH